MNQTELGPKSKEALSWMILSEVLGQSALDLDIAVLHPGGGQYDTLCLVTHDGHPVVQLNRNGSGALVVGKNVENIFTTAAKSPENAGIKIINNLPSDAQSPLSAHRKKRIELAVEVGNFLASNLSQNARCEWGWLDSTDSSGINPAIHDFVIPESWQNREGLFKNTSWESGIFLLYLRGKPHAALNFATGEILDSLGKVLNNITSVDELSGLPRCHVGIHMTWRDKTGAETFSSEVQMSDVRMTRRIYSEEYYAIPEEKRIFSFSCDEDEAVIKWSAAEKFLKADDFLN